MTLPFEICVSIPRIKQPIFSFIPHHTKPPKRQRLIGSLRNFGLVYQATKIIYRLKKRIVNGGNKICNAIIQFVIRRTVFALHVLQFLKVWQRVNHVIHQSKWAYFNRRCQDTHEAWNFRQQIRMEVTRAATMSAF